MGCMDPSVRELRWPHFDMRTIHGSRKSRRSFFCVGQIFLGRKLKYFRVNQVLFEILC